MKPKIIEIPEQDFDLIVQLMMNINRDSDGEFFICSENEDLIQEVNDLIDRVS